MACACKMSASELDRSWSGHSTFRPMRHADDDLDLEDDMERTAASGNYGFTKAIQRDVEASSRKLAKFATSTAHALWSKDPKSAEFLATHARKASSLPAKALIAAMSEIGPKVGKVAAGQTHGLYGFRNKTAKNSLVACQAMREESGRLAHTLATRRADKFGALMAYMEKHCGETDCPYTTMLMQAMPEDKFEALHRTAQDSGAGSASHHFFDNPRRRVVREFAWTKALSNVPDVVPNVVAEYEVLDESKAMLKKQVNETPNTPNETIKGTPGSDQFATLAQYLVSTEQETHKMPNKVPEGHGDINKSPDLSIIHDLVTEKYLTKLANRRGN